MEVLGGRGAGGNGKEISMKLAAVEKKFFVVYIYIYFFSVVLFWLMIWGDVHDLCLANFV